MVEDICMCYIVYYISQNGVFIVDLYFSVSGWNFLIIGLLEIIIVAYMYGKNFIYKI